MHDVHVTCSKGHLECARALIDAGAAVDKVDDYGRAALMKACREGHHEFAQVLIDAGSAVDKVNKSGWTALMYACCMGRHKCARALIVAGAAVDMVDNYECTALMKACEFGHDACAQALIDARADVELTNQDGQTALMITCNKSRNSTSSTGKAACALALIESMVRIREVVVADQTASLKAACERHQVLQVVLITSHVIECAPAALERASVLVSDVQSIVVAFARDMLVQRPLANVTLDGLAIVGDSST